MIWKKDFFRIPRVRKRMIPGHGYVTEVISNVSSNYISPEDIKEKERKEKLKKKIQISLRKDKLLKLNKDSL